MPQTTYLQFFTDKVQQSPKELTVRLLRELGAREDLMRVSRRLPPSPSYERHMNGVYQENEISLRRCSLGEMEQLFDERKAMWIEFFDTDMSFDRRFAQAVWDQIPEDVRGRVSLGSGWIYSGEHDVFGDSEDAEGELYGHGRFSLVLWSYGTPPSLPQFTEAVMQLPIFSELQTLVESIVGPVNSKIYFAL